MEENIKNIGLDSKKKVARFFSQSGRKYKYTKKNQYWKICNSKPHSFSKIIKFKFPMKVQSFYIYYYQVIIKNFAQQFYMFPTR